MAHPTDWVKLKPPIFGVHTLELTPELRQKIGSNKGVIVSAVIRNSPAWSADILNGDIITRIGDIEIIDVKTCSKVITDYAGKKVTVEFFRNAQKLTKEITFNNNQYQ